MKEFYRVILGKKYICKKYIDEGFIFGNFDIDQDLTNSLP